MSLSTIQHYGLRVGAGKGAGADSSDLSIFQRYLPYVQLGDGSSTIKITKKLVLDMNEKQNCFSSIRMNWDKFAQCVQQNSIKDAQFHVTAEFFYLGKSYKVMVVLPVNLDHLETLDSWTAVNQKTAFLDQSDAMSLLAQKIQKRILWHRL